VLAETRVSHLDVLDCLGEVRMSTAGKLAAVWSRAVRFAFVAALICAAAPAQTAPQNKPKPQAIAHGRTVSTAAAKPKLLVVLVVDQMRADYVDKFLGQWTGGLKRLVEQGAWFRQAAYPYAATETCVGHSTISTGALPATHGMVANAWWDRDAQKMVTCTADPNVKNIGYAGISVKGGDSAWRMLVPAFAEELKFQSGGPTRVVTFSLKARASITLAGHKADAVTWFDPAAGAWVTSSAYATAPFIEEYAKAHPAKEDYGKSWSLTLAKSAYLYEEKALGAAVPPGVNPIFPHVLHGKGGPEPDAAFYEEWQASPFADAALTKLAEAAVDSLDLGKRGATDYLGVAYSSLDYAGHAFGPRSWEVQDILVRLDRDLAELFAHLDKNVGRANYVVALTADHGVVPIPEDMQQTGADAGRLHIPDMQQRIEKALEPLDYPKPAVARITGSDVFFAPGVYERLQGSSAAMHAVIQAIENAPGVEGVYTAAELADRPATHNPLREAMADSFFAARSGDLFIVPRAYWLLDASSADGPHYGTGHGTPWNYDQHVPLLFMGFDIRPGQYYEPVTPVDIALTLAALCGITLAPRDGHVLGEALSQVSSHEVKP
jgi:predicted AlkP superfamily pyrophosphatase or phosphodiesterase